MQHPRSLHNSLKTSAANTSRLIDLTTQLSSVDLDDLADVAQEENISAIIANGEQIKAARDQENKNYGVKTFSRQSRREQYAQHIRNKLALGWTPQKIREQIDNRKIWDTFTPHPNNDKSAEGEAAIGKVVLQGNSEELREEMRGQELTPRIKDELQDETNRGLSHLETYMDGALNYLQDLQGGLDDALGEDTFDLRDTNIDIAPRDWFAGDADGKLVPPEVLFAKRLQGAVRGAQKYISILSSVPKSDRAKLQPAIDAFESLKLSLS